MTRIKRPSHSWTLIGVLCLLLLGSTLSLQAQDVMPTATVIFVSDATDPTPTPTSTSEESTAIPTDVPVEPTATWTPTDSPVEPTATGTITPTLTLVATDTPMPANTPMPTATFTPAAPTTESATSTPSAEITVTATIISETAPMPTVAATGVVTETATETPTETPTEIPTPLAMQMLAGSDVMGAVQTESSSLVVTAQDVTFSPTQLTGSTATIDGTTTVWVADDATGLGAGWHLTVAATDFVNGSHTIPKEGFAMRLLDAGISVISGNTQPSASTAFATFTSIGATRTFASAGANEGMGSYNLLPTFQLSVPAQSYAGTYLSTITVTAVVGPSS